MATMTEEEARKKWCPYSLAGQFDDGGDHPETRRKYFAARAALRLAELGE
jgi:hypothetical protein